MNIPVYRGFHFALTDDITSFCDMFSFKENKLSDADEYTCRSGKNRF
jgi:hypothetical protein